MLSQLTFSGTFFLIAKVTKYSYSSDEIDNEDDRIPVKTNAPAADSDDDYQINNDIAMDDTPTKAPSMSGSDDPFDSIEKPPMKRKLDTFDDSDKSDSTTSSMKPAKNKKTCELHFLYFE